MQADIETRGLPSAIEAERLILGSILEGHVSVADIPLDAADFALEKHRRIFLRVQELYERGEAVNVITVFHALKSHGEAESVDGLSYLTELQGDGFQVNVDSFVKLVRDKSLLRCTIAACYRTVNECLNGDPPAELLSRAERALRELGDGAQESAELRSPEEIIERHPGGLNAILDPSRNPGIRPPWPSVARLITGFRPAQLVIVAARTGFGKSAAACQIAESAARDGAGVALFSLEMSATELLQRLACARASVDSHKLRLGRLNEVERFSLQRALTDIIELPLRIDDRTGCSVPAIHAALRRLRSRQEVGLVIVDYLQLLSGPGRRENRTQEVSAITRGLKLLAREFSVPVIALAQLNRASETERRRPILADLRESGSIEQDADAVVFIHWLETENGATSQPCEFIVAKQRSGPRGKAELRFNSRLTRFEEPNVSGENQL